jgi:hypothetical protein
VNNGFFSRFVPEDFCFGFSVLYSFKGQDDGPHLSEMRLSFGV